MGHKNNKIMLYPTKEEILAAIDNDSVIDISSPLMVQFKSFLALWKKEIWRVHKDLNNNYKFQALIYLLNHLHDIFSQSQQSMDNMYISTDRQSKKSSEYDPAQNRIILRSPPSIITTLHEFGHFIYGENELKACVFSIHLFKTTFPKSYDKLKWTGHMLHK